MTYCFDYVTAGSVSSGMIDASAFYKYCFGCFLYLLLIMRKASPNPICIPEPEMLLGQGLKHKELIRC